MHFPLVVGVTHTRSVFPFVGCRIATTENPVEVILGFTGVNTLRCRREEKRVVSCSWTGARRKLQKCLGYENAPSVPVVSQSRSAWFHIEKSSS